jgi:hypothetical protein
MRMTIKELSKLLEIGEDLHFPPKIPIGTKFLMGKNMISQKDNKVEGDTISYFIVTESRDDDHVFFKVIMEKLDK